MILKHAWKELLADKRFFLLFLLNMALGLSGLLTMDAFRSAIRNSADKNAINYLTADIAVSVRRPFTETELKAIRQTLPNNSAQSIEMFSMARSGPHSRLALLKAVSPSYPLKGYIELTQKGTLGKGAASYISGNKAWIDPDLAKQLRVSIGDKITLGEKTFLIEDLIQTDPANSFRGMAIAGKIFLSIDALKDSALLKQESTATYTQFFESSNPELSKKELERVLDPSIRVSTSKDSSGESARMLDILSDFLGLAAIVALLLSALGTGYLFYTWLVRRSRVMAIQIVLGFTQKRALLIPFTQSILLSILAFPLTLLFSMGELFFLEKLVSRFSPQELNPSISLHSILLSLLLSSLVSLLLSLPFLLSQSRTSLRDLVAGKVPEIRFRASTLLYFIPATLFLYVLAFLQTKSYWNALIFFSVLFLSMAGILLAGVLLLRSLSIAVSSIPHRFWRLRQASLHLSRKGLHTLSAFLAIALGALLLNLLPQLRSTLSTELERPQSLPSLFLFDIQEDQLSGLSKTLQNEHLLLENVSPMIRARLLRINGSTYERATEKEFQTREEEMEARSRNRGFNLSYRDDLRAAETIVDGSPLPKFQTGTTPLLSVEERFAKRLGLKLGDTLLFDIQGIEIEGKIANLRKVRWTSFQPNFFILFQDGVINEAPKIFLASIAAIEEHKKLLIQDAIVSQFPNISMIDVKSTITKILELADRMRWSLYLMAFISLFAGLVVLFSIANRQAENRRWDMNLCKVLGASSSDLRYLLSWEFGMLSFTAAFFGGLLSVLCNWLLAKWLFQTDFSYDGTTLFFTLIGATLLALLVSLIGSSRIWQKPPTELLQESS